MDAVIDEDRLLRNISDNIVQLLKERNWSQAELARRTGQTGTEISRIINAKYLPNVGILAKVADALQVTLDFLAYSHPEISSPAR
jgi:transcriptional regulator with XRE-family HTH domain